MRDSDINAESEFMGQLRTQAEHQRQKEPCFYISIEAERVFEEKPIGQETPTFADGTQAFSLKLRDSIGKKLYEELDERYGDEE